VPHLRQGECRWPRERPSLPRTSPWSRRGRNDIQIEVQDATEPGDDNFGWWSAVPARSRRSSTTSRPRRASRRRHSGQDRVPADRPGGDQQRHAMEPAPHAKVGLAGGAASLRSASRRGLQGKLRGPHRIRRTRGDRSGHDARGSDLMGAYESGVIDLEGVQAVQLAMIAHCELMGDRVAILDSPRGSTRSRSANGALTKRAYDSKYATLYWPGSRSSTRSRARACSSPRAAIWPASGPQRRQQRRSQGAANEVIRGVLDLELLITKGEHEPAQPQGINCIRARRPGIRPSARAPFQRPAWRYLNVRRLFNFMRSRSRGHQWVVFERTTWRSGSASNGPSQLPGPGLAGGALFGATRKRPST